MFLKVFLFEIIFRGNDFATLKKSIKMFLKTFSCKPVFQEMILQP